MTGRTATTCNELQELLDLASDFMPRAGMISNATSLDHIYPGNKTNRFTDVHPNPNVNGHDENALPIITLYAATGTTCFFEFHDMLSRVAMRGEVLYVHRPILMHGCERHRCLSVGTGSDFMNAAGFGVELAIRNIEYKSVNGVGMNDYLSSDFQGQHTHDLAAIEGFNFTTMLDRFSRLHPQLRSFKATLLQNSIGIGASPGTWHVRDIGLQVTQRIVSAANPLNFMVDVLQDFPSFTSSLSRVHIDGKMRADISAHQKNMRQNEFAMRLNGNSFELDTVDIFSLTDKIVDDIRVGDSLHRMGLTQTQTLQLLQMQSAPRGDLDDMYSRLTLDDSDVSELVIWMNDIEADAEFEHFSPNIDQFYAERGGSIPRIKRNLFNIVAVVDLSRPSDWDFVDTVHRYIIDHSMPLRLGLVLVDIGTGGLHSNGDFSRSHDNLNGCKAPEENELDQNENEQARLCLHSGLPIGTAIARAGVLLLRDYGGKSAAEFVRKVAMTQQLIFSGNTFDVPAYSSKIWSYAENKFIKVFKRAYIESAADGKRPIEDAINGALNLALNDILFMGDGEGDAHSSISRSAHYLNEVKSAIVAKGVTASSVLVNGLYCSLLDAQKLNSNLGQMAIHLVLLEARALKRAVLEGELTDAMIDAYPDGIYGWLHRNAISKSVPLKFDTGLFESMYVEMHPAPRPTANEFVNYEERGINADIDVLAYVVGGNKRNVKCTTIWIVADAGNDAGEALVDASIDFVHGKLNSPGCLPDDVRVAVLHPPWAVPSPEARDMAMKFRGRNLNDSELDHLLREQGAFVSATLGLDYAAHLYANTGGLIIMNGRVISIPDDVLIEQDDLCTLMSDYHNTVVNRVRNIVHGKSVIDEFVDQLHIERQSDLCMLAMSFVTLRHSSSVISPDREHTFKHYESSLAAIDIPSNGLSMLELVLDPLSKHAQRITPLLTALRYSLSSQLGVRVIFSPIPAVENMPIRSYYRYANPPAHIGAIPLVHFFALPRTILFTVHLDVPEMWLVNTVEAKQDLDNLILEQPQSTMNTVEVEYRIEALLVTGHCIEHGNIEHPRGLQLVLGNTETIVMSNLGYFQLPSSPGIWPLTLRPGRSADIFSILPLAEGVVYKETLHQDVEAVRTSRTIVVSSWRGKRVRLLVRRKEGMASEDVLNPEGDDLPKKVEQKKGSSRSQWQAFSGEIVTSLDTLKSMISSILADGLKAHGTGTAVSNVVQVQHAKGASTIGVSTEIRSSSPGFHWAGSKIHIFSLASGHLYERFLRIMVLSVRRNTRNPLKFWFIKNWLSPRFKDSLPRFALKYGFEYEYVTYKWPTWLHKQTEKQRIIWAYKLLFLDVMFPLTLNKVIFLDADQVVRADVKELWELDLLGAPYAYTPFCDDNAEVEGFRFWKQGFWKDHLQGKPYHISALYVVDLQRFRQLAAGDQLRIFYENLSRDPNSLANLDQDLPNYAQHQVPIFSLPQHWLWCESWCAKQTKMSAKTIDLCNNPMTKEPKLIGASRIIAEWDDLDEELSSSLRDWESRSGTDRRAVA